MNKNRHMYDTYFTALYAHTVSILLGARKMKPVAREARHVLRALTQNLYLPLAILNQQKTGRKNCGYQNI